MKYIQAEGKADNLINCEPFWWGDHHIIVDSVDIERLIQQGFFTATGSGRGVALNISPEGVEWFRANGLVDNFCQLNQTRWISFTQQEHAMLFKLSWS